MINLEHDWLISSELKIDNIENQLDLSVEKIKSNTQNTSTMGKNSYQYNLRDTFLKTNTLSNILQQIKNKTLSLLKENKVIEKDYDLELKNAWTVIGYENSYHILHNHLEVKAPHISTVLYIENSNNIDENQKYAGNFYFIIKDNKYIQDHIIIPEKYKFLVFPTWLYHGTYPQLKGKRQTLNLDFEVISSF